MKVYTFKCLTCNEDYPTKLTYYRNIKMCGWCGHKKEFGIEAKSLSDLIPITRLIVRVKIDEEKE